MSELRETLYGRRSWTLHPYEFSRGEQAPEIQTPFIDRNIYTTPTTGFKDVWPARYLTMTEYEDCAKSGLTPMKYKKQKALDRPYYRKRDDDAIERIKF